MSYLSGAFGEDEHLKLVSQMGSHVHLGLSWFATKAKSLAADALARFHSDGVAVELLKGCNLEIPAGLTAAAWTSTDCSRFHSFDKFLEDICELLRD